MKYITAQQNMADDIHFCLHTAIKTVYPKYYPKEVADFFCHHHSIEHRGYKTVGHGILDLENGVKLVYEIMEKRLEVRK